MVYELVALLYSLPTHIKTMGQLWFLTGEDVYAHTARILLERFMEVYPDIDGQDLTYDGTDWGVYVKMTGTYWEGPALRNMVWGIELLLPNFDAALISFILAAVRRMFSSAAARSLSASLVVFWSVRTWA